MMALEFDPTDDDEMAPELGAYPGGLVPAWRRVRPRPELQADDRATFSVVMIAEMSEVEYINPDYPGDRRRPRWLAVVVMLLFAGIIAFTGNRFREALIDSSQQTAQEVCEIINHNSEPVPIYVFPYVQDCVIDTMQPRETYMVVSASRLFYQIETADGEKGLVRKEAVKLNGLCRSKR
jgi:hypothetical protein